MHAMVERLEDAVGDFEFDVQRHLDRDGSQDEANEILERFAERLQGIVNEAETSVAIMRAFAAGEITAGEQEAE